MSDKQTTTEYKLTVVQSGDTFVSTIDMQEVLRGLADLFDINGDTETDGYLYVKNTSGKPIAVCLEEMEVE